MERVPFHQGQMGGGALQNRRRNPRPQTPENLLRLGPHPGSGSFYTAGGAEEPSALHVEAAHSGTGFRTGKGGPATDTRIQDGREAERQKERPGSRQDPARERLGWRGLDSLQKP